jgi:hypothetical protein
MSIHLESVKICEISLLCSRWLYDIIENTREFRRDRFVI